MKLILDIKEDRISFFMELIKNFDFISNLSSIIITKSKSIEIPSYKASFRGIAKAISKKFNAVNGCLY